VKHPLTRGAALVAGAAATTLAVVATATPAVAGPADKQQAAAGWLAGQLDGGVAVNEQHSFNDYGLSIDTGLALRAQGLKTRKVSKISAAMAEAVDSYTTGGEPEGAYSGATAKLASFVVRTGGDPDAFGGVDLVERLEGLVSTEAPTTGRLQDRSTYGDFANSIGQAFAAHALHAVGSEQAAPVTSYLLQQQCEAGYFRLSFSPAAAPDQGCDAAPGDPDQGADVTALVVLNLLEVAAPSAEVVAAVDDATAWLVAQQSDGGAFGGGADAGVNSNSTGLAGWALGEAGMCGKAQEAARWVKKQQAGARDKALGVEKGAIAYDRAAFLTGKKEGITEQTRDQWHRATAQAAPALENLRKVECKA
jgi:hypothetical protein